MSTADEKGCNFSRTNLQQLFLKGLKLDMAMSDPEQQPREKKICVAASTHTRGSLRRLNLGVK